jgi:hypothetical protein
MAAKVCGKFRGNNPFILNGETYQLEWSSISETGEYYVWIKDKLNVQVTCYNNINTFLDDWDILLRTLQHESLS